MDSPTQTNPPKGNDWTPEEVPQLTVDVYRKANIIFIVSTVAGVKPEDLDVSVDGHNVTVKGSRKKPYESSQEMLLEECFWGDFSRDLTISENFDIDRIKASLENGILIIEVPIVIITGQKKIPVNFTK
jgi:HSP20 family protein